MMPCPVCAHPLPAEPVANCPNCPACFERPNYFAQLREGAVVLALWVAFAAASILWAPLSGEPVPEGLLQVWRWATVACACWLVWAAHRTSMKSLDAMLARYGRD